MSSRRAALDAHLARNSGLVTIAELRQLGYTDDGAASLVRRQALRVIFPGVYRSAAWPPGRTSTLLAVCRRNPHAAISHTTAGQELGIRSMSGIALHALVPHSSSPVLAGVVVHRCRRIDELDVVELANGLRVTSVERTLFDAAGLIGADRTESALEHVLHHELSTVDRIMATLDRLDVGGRPGGAELRAVFRRRPAWSQAVESELELRLLRALRAHGFPEPHRQYLIEVGGGRNARADVAYPDWKLVLEADHPYWHATRRAAERDRARDRELAALGWRVVRFTDTDLTARVTASMRQLREIVTSRR